MGNLKRMWINQPSTSQPYHALHGTNVLAVKEYGSTYCIFFLCGPIVSQQIDGAALSPGWREPPARGVYQEVLRKYLEQQDDNAHSENALLLAQTFGSEAEIAKAMKLLADYKRLGMAVREHIQFQAEMSQKYYPTLVSKGRIQQ